MQIVDYLFGDKASNILWRQGFQYPIENKGFASDSGTLNKRRLPKNFVIDTWCENCENSWIEAKCETENEVWNKVVEVGFEKNNKL